jgi:DNA polymerase
MQERLENIQADIERELSCPLKEAAINLVFGKGNSSADVFIIGEAPGAKEDEQGEPFVGKAGKNLDALLQIMDLGIEDVYIANILKYRPPKNRDPKPDEIAAHTPYLVRQICAVNPKIIITLGNFATKFVLSGFNCSEMKGILGISELHGQRKEITVDGESFIVIPMFHPAAMIYRPKLKEVIENDFLEAKKFL